MTAGGVVVLGSVNVDVTVVLDRLPRAGETVSGGVLRRDHGGKGGNQAVAAARAGAAVRFVGAVGRDADGDDVLAVLAGDGVDVSAVRRVEAATGTALICVDAAGENQIAVAPGANRHASAEGLDLAGVDVVVAQLEAPLDAVAALFERARAAGARTVLNAAPVHSGQEDAIRAALGIVDVLVVNEGELDALHPNTGPVAERAAALAGPGAVLVSRGAAGVVWAAAGHDPVEVAGHRVDAVDTVGAGDALCGALAAGLALGLDDETAVRRANAAGALAATRPGARSSPTAAEVDALLAGDGTVTAP
ncbi:MAG: ribokinase [Acidimicrobiales bacterium]|nr:ribokinase [Acidimicrobiales bacterium]